MELQSGSHISCLAPLTVKHVSRGLEYAWNDMQMRLCIVKLGVVSSMVISVRNRGEDARMHNLPLTGIYKGIFAQVLAYACFYIYIYI